MLSAMRAMVRYAMNDERRSHGKVSKNGGKMRENKIKCGKYCKSGNFFICFTRARARHSNSRLHAIQWSGKYMSRCECAPIERVAAGTCCCYYYYFHGRNSRNRHLFNASALCVCACVGRM